MAIRIMDMIFYWLPVGTGRVGRDQSGARLLKVELHGTAGRPVGAYLPTT